MEQIKIKSIKKLPYKLDRYDLTINTSKISVENAVDLILDFSRYMDAKKVAGIDTPESKRLKV